MPITINLNSRIKVKLTEEGINTYRQIHKKAPKADRAGFVEIQFWEFANTFKDMIHSFPEGTDIHLTEFKTQKAHQ